MNVFNTLTSKQIFWKTKIFYKKLEYYFLFESTKTENTSIPYKTAILETNVKTTRERLKNGVLPITTLIFWKFCFSLRPSYKELFCWRNDPNVHIHTFISTGILFEVDFILWVSLSELINFYFLTNWTYDFLTNSGGIKVN